KLTMSTEDAFVHSILNHPDDDTTRLVFSDWLEEHGRASHAELIRIQCELARLPKRSREPTAKARREELAAREKELLRQPEFFPTWPAGMPTPRYETFKHSSDAPKLKYERGFIAAIRVFDGELMAPEWAQSPWHTLLREGKALALEMHGDQGGLQTTYFFDRYEMSDLAEHASLSRVTLINLFEGRLTDDNLGVLARSRLLTELREVWFGDCRTTLDAIRALVASPSIKQLRELWMGGVYIAGDRRGSRVWRLWELVASSPNMASLERLWIGPLDDRAAQALSKSPYLKESLRICPDPSWDMGRAWEKWALTGDLSAANVKALRARYPGTPF
ncbi:MAG: TIGR02996 domain-containing protein, partial [Gemmataceae bacterium]|nr:TIGR02996 domain-containing protein [Gemmataceae bacterium]